MKNKKIYKIAIVIREYCSYLYNFLNKTKNICAKNSSNFEISYVSARNKNKKRNIKIKNKQWIKNYKDIVYKKDVDIIIELIGGSDGAA